MGLIKGFFIDLFGVDRELVNYRGMSTNGTKKYAKTHRY